MPGRLPAPLKAAETQTSFVIGPIGNKFADEGSSDRRTYEQAIKVFEEVIQPACKEFGLEPVRSDLMSQPGEIPEQVFRLLRDADIVIADLTDSNPNVMYELGLRHTLEKCTIQLAEHGRISFDVSVIRTIQFKRSAGGLFDARDELKNALKHCIRGDHLPVTATRVWSSITAIVEQAEREISAAVGEVSEPSDEPGFLDRLVAMEVALPRGAELITEVGALIEGISELLKSSAQEVTDADRRGEGAVARLTIAAKLAKRLAAPAGEMERIVDEYEKTVADIEPGVDYLFTVAESDPERAKEISEFAHSVVLAAEKTAEWVRVSEQNAVQMADLGKITTTLRGPTSRLAAATRRLAAASSRFIVWGQRARSLQGLESTKWRQT